MADNPVSPQKLLCNPQNVFSKLISNYYMFRCGPTKACPKTLNSCLIHIYHTWSKKVWKMSKFECHTIFDFVLFLKYWHNCSTPFFNVVCCCSSTVVELCSSWTISSCTKFNTSNALTTRSSKFSNVFLSPESERCPILSNKTEIYAWIYLVVGGGHYCPQF